MKKPLGPANPGEIFGVVERAGKVVRRVGRFRVLRHRNDSLPEQNKPTPISTVIITDR